MGRVASAFMQTAARRRALGGGPRPPSSHWQRGTYGLVLATDQRPSCVLLWGVPLHCHNMPFRFGGRAIARPSARGGRLSISHDISVSAHCLALSDRNPGSCSARAAWSAPPAPASVSVS